MTGEPLDARNLKWIEYIDEAALGTFPTNPTMLALPGFVTDFSFTSGAEFDSYMAFKGATDTDPLSCGIATKAGETHEWSVEMKMTSLGLLPHALLAATKTTYAPGIVHLPFSLGGKIGTGFTTWNGCVIDEWVVDIPDTTTAATLSISGRAMNRTDFSTTYVGTGAHASNPATAVLTMADLTNVEYDNAAFSTADLSIESLKFGITNNADPVLDIGSALGSKIGNWSFKPREYTLELGATLLDVTAIDDVKDGAAHEVEFDFGSKTFTFTNVIWTNAPDISMNPEDLIGMTLTADPAAVRLAIS